MNLDPFITMCRSAVTAKDPVVAVRSVVEDFVADPAPLGAAFPAPKMSLAVSGESKTIFENDAVSIMFVHAPPQVAQPPHDHRMPVVIGGYVGTELHRLYRRVPGEPAQDQAAIELSGGAEIGPGDVFSLGAMGIHAIDAAEGAWSSAVHVYLGQLSTVSRSLFHPETFVEEPLDLKVYDRYCGRRSP